jgi:hypothetical protein
MKLSPSNEGLDPMDKLLAKLSEQSAAITKQTAALKASDDNTAYMRTAEYVSAGSSFPVTPANEIFNQSTTLTTSTPSPGTEALSADDVLRLKLELEAAKGKIARMDQELAQTRITKHTIDQAIGSASEADYPLNSHDEISVPHYLQPSQSTQGRNQGRRDNTWAAQEDSRSDTDDSLSASGFSRTRAIWGPGGKPQISGSQPGAGVNFQPSGELAATQWMSRGFGQPFIDEASQYPGPPMGAPMNSFREHQLTPESDVMLGAPGHRRNNAARFNQRNVGSYAYSGSGSSYDAYNPASSSALQYGSLSMGSNAIPVTAGPMLGMNMGSMSNVMSGGAPMYGGYQPQPIGTPLSPHAPEFTSSTSGWKNDVSNTQFVHIRL